MGVRSTDTVRPTLTKGQLVDVTRTGADVQRVEATVISVDAPRVVLRGRHLRSTAGSRIGLTYSDGLALIEFDVEVDEVNGRDVTVVVPEAARRIQRRHHARIAVDVPMVLLVARPSGRAAMQRATTVDMSAGGAAVRMSNPPPDRTRTPFVLRYADGLEVTGVAFVLDSVQERRDRHRVRLRFDQLRTADREALASWVFRHQVERR